MVRYKDREVVNLMNLLDYDYVLANTPNYTEFLCYVIFIFVSFSVVFIYKKLEGRIKLKDLWERKEYRLISISILSFISLMFLLSLFTDIVMFDMIKNIFVILVLLFIFGVLEILFLLKVSKLIDENIKQNEIKKGISNTSDAVELKETVVKDAESEE